MPEQALAVAVGHGGGSEAVEAALAQAARDFAEVRDEAPKWVLRRARMGGWRPAAPWPDMPRGWSARRPRYRD